MIKRRAQAKPSPSPKASEPPFTWDKYALYELCAQNPSRDAKLLRAIYSDRQQGLSPPRVEAKAGRVKTRSASRKNALKSELTLGEDFCAAAALSRAWCKLDVGYHAVAVDRDAEVLGRATVHPRVRLVHSDVRAAKGKVDLIAVQNFSICELHTRPQLVEYLKTARKRIAPGGCFICDIYGGADSMLTSSQSQRIRPPAPPHPGAKDKIEYSWQQRACDQSTGRVINAMHFRVRPAAGQNRKPQVMMDAFVYDWRLWSVPELRDAMSDAGFSDSRVYPREPDAVDEQGDPYIRPIDDPAELECSFNVYVVASRR